MSVGSKKRIRIKIMSSEGKIELYTLMLKTLHAVPEEQFNMRVWGLKHKCGTVACLAGHTALTEEAQAKGISYYWDDGDLTIGFDALGVDEHFGIVYELTEVERLDLARLFHTNHTTKQPVIDMLEDALRRG